MVELNQVYDAMIVTPPQTRSKLRVVDDPGALEPLLGPVEQVAEVTRNEQAETLKFLQAYGG
jgi:hypothetical protein